MFQKKSSAITESLNNKPKQHGSLFIPALANFHVQYNFQSIAIALVVMSDTYEQSSWVSSALRAVVFAGAIAGQLTFGAVGDLIGRNRAMFITNSVTVVGCLGSALLSWGDATSIYIAIIVSRFFLGLGVGGVYPLSATKAAEDAHSATAEERTARVSWAFFWQVPGSIVPFIVALIGNELFSVDLQFRIILGIGALPALVCLLGTFRSEETKEFLESKASQQGLIATLRDHSDYIPKLIGVGGSWFLYDVCYYGTALFAPKILNSIFGNDNDVKSLSYQGIISNAMGLPAIFITIYLFRYMSSKSIQIWGFILIALAYILLAIMMETEDDITALVFVFYCVLIFALNAGPNVTTFTLPQETFPTEIRSTFNGVAAALAKFGALIGAYIYDPLNDLIGLSATMYLCAGLSVFGAIVTYYFIDTPEQSRSQLLGEHPHA